MNPIVTVNSNRRGFTERRMEPAEGRFSSGRKRFKTGLKGGSPHFFEENRQRPLTGRYGLWNNTNRQQEGNDLKTRTLKAE